MDIEVLGHGMEPQGILDSTSDPMKLGLADGQTQCCLCGSPVLDAMAAIHNDTTGRRPAGCFATCKVAISVAVQSLRLRLKVIAVYQSRQSN